MIKNFPAFVENNAFSTPDRPFPSFWYAIVILHELWHKIRDFLCPFRSFSQSGWTVELMAFHDASWEKMMDDTAPLIREQQSTNV
jgi:hypothetical protein